MLYLGKIYDCRMRGGAKISIILIIYTPGSGIRWRQAKTPRPKHLPVLPLVLMEGYGEDRLWEGGGTGGGGGEGGQDNRVRRHCTTHRNLNRVSLIGLGKKKRILIRI